MTTQTQDPNEVAPAVADLDTIVSLSKRRGFIFPSSEIYGGINNVFDKDPPIIVGQGNYANTYPATYDYAGMNMFVGVTVKTF